MTTTRGASTRGIGLGSGTGLVTGAALGMVFDSVGGQPGLGLAFGAAVGLVLRGPRPRVRLQNRGRPIRRSSR